MPSTYVVCDGSDSSRLTITAGANGLKIVRLGATLRAEQGVTAGLSLSRSSSVSGGSSLTPTPLRDAGASVAEATVKHGASETTGAGLGTWIFGAGNHLRVGFPGGIDVSSGNSVTFDWVGSLTDTGTLYVNVWFEE